MVNISQTTNESILFEIFIFPKENVHERAVTTMGAKKNGMHLTNHVQVLQINAKTDT